jgi:hypothetical protein
MRPLQFLWRWLAIVDLHQSWCHLQLETKNFCKAIADFRHHFNEEGIDQLSQYKGKQPERTIPLFSHSINAQQIRNARITGESKLGVHRVHSLAACKRIDRKNHLETLRIVAKQEFTESIAYTNSKGTEFTNSI